MATTAVKATHFTNKRLTMVQKKSFKLLVTERLIQYVQRYDRESKGRPRGITWGTMALLSSTIFF